MSPVPVNLTSVPPCVFDDSFASGESVITVASVEYLVCGPWMLKTRKKSVVISPEYLSPF